MRPQGRRSEVIAVAAGSLLLATLFSLGVFHHLGAAPWHDDWDEHLHYHVAPYLSVARFHQLPMWDPYMCGGTPLWANSQTRFLTPFFLIHLLVGPIVGFELEIWLHLAIVAAGAYVLARVAGVARGGGAAAGVVFATSSWYALQLCETHSWAMAYAYMPLAIACYLQSLKTRRWSFAVAAGALLALMVCEGGIYPAPQTALLLSLIAVAIAIARRDWRPLATLAVTAGFAFGLAAPKLLPVYHLMKITPRLTESIEVVGLGWLWESISSRNQLRYRAVPAEQSYYKFHEYGAYLGAIAMALAGLGVVTRLRRAWPWLLLALLLLCLAVGSQPLLGVLAPWPWLHKLPLFASQHVPTRYLVPFVMCAAVLVGFGADAVAAWRPPVGKWLTFALISAMAVDSWLVVAPILDQAFDEAPAPSGLPPPSAEFTQAWTASINDMVPLALGNHGAVNCYELARLPAAAKGSIEPGYRGEVYLDDARGGVATVSWSPNRLTFDVDAAEATELVVNQNYDDGWHVAAGAGWIHSLDGLIAVSVPAGKQRLTLSYVAPGLVTGTIIGLIAAALAALVCWRERRRAA